MLKLLKDVKLKVFVFCCAAYRFLTIAHSGHNSNAAQISAVLGMIDWKQTVTLPLVCRATGHQYWTTSREWKCRAMHNS